MCVLVHCGVTVWLCWYVVELLYMCVGTLWSYCMVVLVCCRVTVHVCWYTVELLYGCVGML